MENNEMVAHPSHYNQGQYEVIDVIEDWNLGFNIGNVVKYCARSEFKGKPIEDLQKAAFYLDREIKIRKRNQENQKKDTSYMFGGTLNER